MKHTKFLKIISLILTSAFLLLNGCTSQNDETSDTSSADELSTEESGDASADVKYTLVSVGKPYTVSFAAQETYPDNGGCQLTDGLKTVDDGCHYSDPRMVGFVGTTNVIVDLGEDGKALDRFSVRSLNLHSDGVKLAYRIRIYGSADGEKWTGIGQTFFEAGADNSMSTAVVEPKDGPCDFRYIKVSIVKRDDAGFFFVDEVEIYANVPEKTKQDAVAAAYESEAIDRDAWKTLATGSTNEYPYSETVSNTAKVVFTGVDAFDSRAGENAGRLTDAEPTGRAFEDDVWVGISAKQNSEITLNMGKINSDVYLFRAHMLGEGPNVVFPAYIDVFGGKTKEEKVFLGRMYGPRSSVNYAYTLILPQSVSLQYVTFALPQGPADAFYWAEELQVVAGTADQPSQSIYSDVLFPDATERLLWDASEEDYRKEQNLLYGKQQQISSSQYVTAATADRSSPETLPVLTDGELARDTYCYSSGWFCCIGSGARDFFFDLGRSSALKSFKIHTMEQVDYGISKPKYARIWLSEDAENWYLAAEKDATREEKSVLFRRIEWSFELERSCSARFVRFEIEFGGFLFVDELEAFGTKEITAKTMMLSDTGWKKTVFHTHENTKQFATTENTTVHASDIVIVCNNKTKRESLLPMVAHLSAEGEITDTFMDGFLYSPTSDLPSGKHPYQDTVKKDWDFTRDSTFNGECGLDALNEIVGTVKDALHIPDYKVQVYFSALTLHDTVSDFGDVDGDGVSEDATTEEGRRKIIRWYVQSCMQQFAEKAYENLELDGFYWQNEAVLWEHDDAYVIAEATEEIHAAGSNLLWVPYYNANRYYVGYTAGFDSISMQPNYVFRSSESMMKLDATVELAKKYQMSVEIEHTNLAFGNRKYIKQYMDYLRYGAETGYMDAIHVYYDDFENYALMYERGTPLCRMQYDATYQFAKRKLVLAPEKKADVQISASKNKIAIGTLNSDGAEELYFIAEQPAHGSVVLEEDGTYAYLPEKNYTGEDSFAYTYSRYLQQSEKCYVKISVGE